MAAAKPLGKPVTDTTQSVRTFDVPQPLILQTGPGRAVLGSCCRDGVRGDWPWLNSYAQW